METARSILSSLLKDLGLEERVRVEFIRKEWTALFQEPLSLHTCPVGMKNGELLIHVDSPVWLQQLKFFKQDIAKKLQRYGVTEVKLKLGRLYKPLGNRSEGRSVAAPSGKEIRDSEMAWINRTISEIRDPELKENLRRAITKSVARAT
ncbi:MAG TPA: DUF721 domain-containing protein [Dissulfurispiraceae bacterium]